MLEAFENAALDPSPFQTSLFKTANVLLQEMGHVFVTYLSRGQNEEIRSKVKGPCGASVSDFFTADRALEETLFNGTIRYVCDPVYGPSDDQVCSKGLPCSMVSLVARTLMHESSAARPTWRPVPAPIIASFGNQSRRSPATVSSLPIPNDFTSEYPCTINNAFPLEFTFPYYCENLPEQRMLTRLGEGYPPDTYTDPLKEKKAAWLLKEYPK